LPSNPQEDFGGRPLTAHNYVPGIAGIGVTSSRGGA
jgi:hypothetical protein